MGERAVFRRRIYLIKKGFQLRYIGLIFALALLASIITGYTVFATGWTLLGEKLANVYPQGRLAYVLKATNMILIRNLLLSSPVVFILGLIFSHRIAGPVYRIEKSIREISKGNLGLKIHLRERDELLDLADMINNMTEKIRLSFASNKDILIAIQKDLDELKKAASSGPDAIQGALKRLSYNVTELKNALDKWNTSVT